MSVSPEQKTDGAILKDIVEKPLWKSILLNMLYEGKIDPWDVDIDVVIEEFMNEIKRRKELELSLPGNVILACSILLKYKSLRLMVEEVEEQGEEMPLDLTTPQLSLVGREKPKRPITLPELIEVVEKATELEIKPKKAKLKEAFEIKPFIAYKKGDIKKRIAEFVEVLKQNMDDRGIISFFDVVKGLPPLEVVGRFMLTLHLENEGYLYLKQVEPFRELLLILNLKKIAKAEFK